MRAQRHTKSLRGFTLVEVMVVLAISAIVAAVSIPSAVSWYDSYKGTERQANAELIYTTAQNNMAQLKASGQLGDYTDNTGSDNGRVTLAANTRTGSFADSSKLTASPSAQAADASIIVLNSDDANNNGDSDAKKIASALNLLVPDVTGQLSNVGFSSMSYATDAHYRVELNPKTGYVYRVFFSESAIDNKTYQDAAAAATVLEDSQSSAADKTSAQNTLNNLKVNYYGGTTAASFVEDEQEPMRGIGYFEFKQGEGSNNKPQAEITGGYYYGMSADNKFSKDGAVTDKLSNDNQIDENVTGEDSDGNQVTVTSTGTAYGILVPANDVRASFTAPTDVNQTPYKVKLADSTDTRDYYFYELPSPSAKKAKYTIHYLYTDKNGNTQVWYPVEAEHEGPIGSNVSVTNDDLASDCNGYPRQMINTSNYRIDKETSSLRGTVKEDNSLVLTVHLVKDGDGDTDLSGNTNTTYLNNGVGVWYPWSTAPNNTELQSKAFYVNENFAAAINTGTKSTQQDTYQVRTDDQLQHIGSPFGSTYNEPITNYLSGTFYQTHDITINQLWYPIGQRSTGAQDVSTTAFTGKFYGSYEGRSSKNHELKTGGLSEPKTAQPFAINLVGQPNATKNEDKPKQFCEAPAYQPDNNDEYQSYGIFGYITGSISYTNVNIGSTDSSLASSVQLKQELADPHYGTLVGDLVNGTVSHANMTIKSDSSLSITQSGSNGSSNGKTAVGGLCGNMTGTARLTDSTLTLEKSNNAAADGNERFQLTSDANWASSNATNTGGLVGHADCNDQDADKSFIDNCTLTLNDDTRLKASGASSGVVNMGGFIASSVGNGTIAHSKTVVGKRLIFDRTDGDSWGPNISMGGFIGTVGDSSSTADQKNTPAVNASNLSIRTGGSVNVGASYNNASPLTLGGFAGRVTEAASLTNDTVANDGSLSVSGAVESSGSMALGGFAGSIDTATVSQEIGNAVSGQVRSCKVSGTGNLNVNAGTSGIAVNTGGFSGLISSGSVVIDSAIDLKGKTSITSDNSKQNVNNVGGFAGNITDTATVSNPMVSLGSGAISAGAYNDRHVAGVIGSMEKRASASKPSLSATGDVSITAKGTDNDYSASYVGGLIGYAKPDSDTPVTIAGAKADMKGTLTLESTAVSNAYVGGLAGKTDSVSFDTPNLTFAKDLNVTSTGNGYNTERAGGLIGSATGTATIKSPTLKVDGKLSANAPQSGNATAYAGGMFGNAEGTTTVTDPTLTVHEAEISSESANAAYSGGIAAVLEGTSTVTGAKATVGSERSAGSLATSATGSGGASAYTAGLIGRVSSTAGTAISNAKVTVEGNGSFTSTSDDGAYAAGLVGRIDSTNISNARISLSDGMQVQGTTSKRAYTGGLIGHMDSSEASYLSLRGPKDASSSDRPSIAISANAKDNTSPDSGYVGGLIGDAEKSDIRNSYLAARQATLQLNNSIDKDDAYTGGFAGRMQGDSDEKGASFCYVYADIRSDHNKGISAFVDRFDKALMHSCFVVGTMANGNDDALDNAYAFARNSSFGNEYRERPAGDYAAVTDAHGNTPYTFLNWKPEDESISTPGCVIYTASAVDPTPENDPKGRTGKRAYGAHEISYSWLTGNAAYDEAYNTKEFNAEDDPYYYKDFPTYLASKNKGAERYPYVNGSEVASDYRDAGSRYGLTGSNPFPTATKDADGNYINYGKWIPKPKQD